ncbi:GNAT family N-acetyltransferase [Ottowia thiooxydans]|uniref:GNAT superfamily N-acetyltransferase n=1 Tax=Ottowia thiooxydans TaxID=219182 RepID=A0ABV2Q2R1_9BURK
MKSIDFRIAAPEDATACIDLRGRTRENAFSREDLSALGVNEESWANGIAGGSMIGYIGDIEGRMIGYCFGDRDSGEIVVLALLPEYEGCGIGKSLLQLVVAEFRRRGFARLFLGCAADPGVRSYGFYRHLGWKPTGEYDDLGDEILELLIDGQHG